MVEQAFASDADAIILDLEDKFGSWRQSEAWT